MPKNPDARVWECVSEDAEGRSSVVPLTVSAQNLKCMPLTAWERVTLHSRNYSHPPSPAQENARMCARQQGSNPPSPAVSHSKRRAVWGCQFGACPPLLKLDPSRCVWADLLAFRSPRRRCHTARKQRDSTRNPGLTLKWVPTHNACF